MLLSLLHIFFTNVSLSLLSLFKPMSLPLSPSPLSQQCLALSPSSLFTMSLPPNLYAIVFLLLFPPDDTKERPMFGCPLEEHLRLFKTDVAVVLESCCQALRDQWMDTEGLFRIAAGTARVRLLKVGNLCCMCVHSLCVCEVGARGERRMIRKGFF